jgi:DeoR/GlpR family transcriptional regulator of sugar metabolism
VSTATLPPYMTSRVDVDTLSRTCGLSPATVRRALKELEARGLIERRGPAEFVMNVRAIEALPTIKEWPR